MKRHYLVNSKALYQLNRLLTKPCLMIGVSFALAGCAMVDHAKPGTPIAEVIEKFGKPSTECLNADGTKHAVWTQQPFGQTAFGTTIGRDGTIGSVNQLLTDARFNQLSTGEWTPEKVICEFGPPERQGEFGIYEKRSYLLEYRYQQYGVWNALMYLYFDLNTRRLTHFNAGPDPLFELGGRR